MVTASRMWLFWTSVSLVAVAAGFMLVFGTGFAGGSSDEVLPTVPRALASQAGTNISAAQGATGQTVSQMSVEHSALEDFPDAKVRESALVFLDDDVINPPIHRNVWAVSLALPGGTGLLPDFDTGKRAPIHYFVVMFDARTGQFLFGESQ